MEGDYEGERNANGKRMKVVLKFTTEVHIKGDLMDLSNGGLYDGIVFECVEFSSGYKNFGLSGELPTDCITEV